MKSEIFFSEVRNIVDSKTLEYWYRKLYNKPSTKKEGKIPFINSGSRLCVMNTLTYQEAKEIQNYIHERRERTFYPDSGIKDKINKVVAFFEERQ